MDLWLGTPKADEFDIKSGEFVAEINRAQVNVAARYSNTANKVFRSLLTDKTRLVRATEHAESDGESLTLSVLLDYVLTDSEIEALKEAGEQAVLVPFMRLEKGELLDNLDITDPSGRTVPTLSQHETMGLLANAVCALFFLAYVSDDDISDGDEIDTVLHLTEKQERAQWKLLQLVCQRGRHQTNEVSKQFRAAVKHLKGTSPERETELRTFCEFFAKAYMIIAEVPLPAGNHVILKYRKSLPLHGRTGRSRDRLRVWTGLKPRSVSLPLYLPFQTPSYHFRITGTPGQFVSSHYLWDIKKKKVLDQVDIAAMASPVCPTCGLERGQRSVEEASGASLQPYMRVRYRAGLPYGHLYTRGLHGMDSFEVATVVNFDEVPPGALGRARSVSLASSFLVGSFAFIIPAATENSTNLAALILAAPAFVATWVGHSAERMEKSSLTAYIGLVLTGLISIASALLYVTQSIADKPKFEWQPNVFGTTFPSVDVVWLALAVASIATTALLVSQLHNERRRYLDSLKRFNAY